MSRHCGLNIREVWWFNDKWHEEVNIERGLDQGDLLVVFLIGRHERRKQISCLGGLMTNGMLGFMHVFSLVVYLCCSMGCPIEDVNIERGLEQDDMLVVFLYGGMKGENKFHWAR